MSGWQKRGKRHPKRFLPTLLKEISTGCIRSDKDKKILTKTIFTTYRTLNPPTDKPNGAASREVKSFRHQPGGKPRKKRRKALGASPKPGRREDEAHSPGIQANTSYIVPACFAALGSRLRTARHDASYTLRMDRTVCRHANKKVNEAPCYVGFFPNNPYLCSRKQNRYYSL